MSRGRAPRRKSVERERPSEHSTTNNLALGDFGDRVFIYDAFISHNASDGLAEHLAADLARRHVAVWYDGNGDVRDRRVTEKIQRALYHARTIVVSTPGEFRDSAWCRAEYLGGLRVERQAGARRVVVAHHQSAAAIPRELRQSARFDLASGSDCDRLAEYLLFANRRRPVRVKPVPILRPEEERWVRQHGATMPSSELHPDMMREDPLHMALRFLALAIEDDPHPQTMMGWRTVAHEAGRPELTADDRRFVAGAALLLLAKGTTDDRANGSDALVWAADQETAELVWTVLANERKPAVLRFFSQWLLDQPASDIVRHRDVLERAALHAPELFGEQQLSSLQPFLREPARVRVEVGMALDIELLTWRERSVLGRDRIAFIREHRDEQRYLGVEFELAFREIAQAVIDGHDPRDLGGDAEGVYGNWLAACDLLIDAWQSDLDAMLGFATWAADVVLTPLLAIANSPTHAARAIEAYRAICALVRHYESYQREADAVLHVVDEPAPFAEAQRRLIRAMMESHR